MRLLLLTGLLACATCGQAAAPWHVRAWQTDEGLASNEVFSVAQAVDGGMIIAARGGLSRFDGWRLRAVPVELAANGDRTLSAALPARDGSLWFLNADGIGQQRGGAEQPRVPVRKFNPAGKPSAFFEHRDGSVWLCFEGGPVTRLVDGHAIACKVASDVTWDSASTLVVDGKDRVWAAGRGALARWEKESFVRAAALPELPVAICGAREGGTWICAGRQLLRHNDKAGLATVAELPAGAPGTRPSYLLEDREGRVWIGTFGDGLLLWDGHTLAKIALPNQDVSWLCQDHEGSLWAATSGGGVCCVRPQSITMLDEPGAPVMQTARALCTDARGDIWVVLQTNELFTRRSGHWQHWKNGKDWPGSLATCVCADAAGNVWIGADDNSLVRWDGTGFQKFPLPNKVGQTRIRALLAIPDGEVWIGRGTDVLHGREANWETLHSPARSGEVQALALDSKGRVWAGTSGGALFFMRNGTVSPMPLPGLKQGQGIRALLPLADGTLWVGTDGSGVVRVRGESSHFINTTHGLPHNVVSQLALDTQGRVWGAGDRGIFFTALDALNGVVEGRATAVRCTTLGRAEGMPGLQANSGYTPNIMLTSEGRLWSATRSGIALVNTKLAGGNLIPPTPSIETLTINGHMEAIPRTTSALATDASDKAAPATRMTLDPGVRSLGFEFGATSYIAPENVGIEYQLEGVDETWRSAGLERSASYGHVPPGDYTMRLRTTNNDGIGNGHEALLRFKIKPYYHETLWFHLLAITCAVGLISWVVQRTLKARYHRQSEDLRRQAAVHAERTRIARDMHDQIGASLTQICMLSDIALAHGTDSPQLPRLASTARQAITALDEIVWAVDPAQDRFNSLIEYIAPQITELTNAAGLSCHFEFPSPHSSERPLAAAVRHQLFLTIREAVHNAIKHAQASEIKLCIEATASELSIRITDDGQGYAPSSTSGHGLENMNSRITSLGGTCAITSQPGEGTTIAILLPWPAEAPN